MNMKYEMNMKNMNIKLSYIIKYSLIINNF